MIAPTQITVVICGEKKDDKGNLIPSPGVIEEVKISQNQGNLIIPIGVSGGAAKIVWEEMKNCPDKGYKEADFDLLNQEWTSYNKIYESIQRIISNYCS